MPQPPDPRPASNVPFDAGLNASSAWTEARDVPNADESVAGPSNLQSATKDANNTSNSLPPRPARALYSFNGNPELKELVVRAGDELSIVKEDLAEGWSLARYKDELGLIPRKYYTFTTDFIPAASLQSHPTSQVNEPTTTTTMPLPLQPQLTGPYFANLRQTLLGGKSFNRFSNFVTSGAEDWVLHGPSEEEAHPAVPAADQPKNGPEKHLRASTSSTTDDAQTVLGDTAPEPERHYVDMPPAWRSKSPPFKVLVHSPSKHTNHLTGSFTMYCITSLFQARTTTHSRFSSYSTSSHSSMPSTSSQTLTPTMDSHPPLPALGPDDDDSTVHVTVQRRFSHFVFLHTALTRRLPGVALPPLPDKQYAGRFNDDFIEARRGDLERWLSRVVRHPLARYSEVLIFFLSCDNEKEWQQGIPRFLAPPPSPAASFYAHVYHPEFNVDEEDAQETVDKFERHLRVAGQGVQGLRGVFGKVREAGLEMSIAQRALSYSILAMITSTPLDQSPAGTTPSLAYSMTQWEDDEYDEDNKKGLVNDEGAWCWRDECEDCLERTKALQRMAETLQLVADAYDDHARRTQLAVHDALKDIAHPSALYAGVIDTHRSTLSRYTVASADVSSPVGDSHRVARCETVLNATMAEFDTYHTQKGEDIDRIAKDHLDSEIAFHEQVLKRLRTAREAFNTPPDPPPSGKAPTFKAVSPRPVPTPTTSASASFPQPLPPGPRQPSIYERDLAAAYTRAPAPLPQPTAHIYDGATTIRPVSSAVRDGVSMLFGGAGLKTGYAGLGSPTGVGGAGSSVGSPLGSPTSSTGGTSGGGMLPGLPLPAIPGLNRGSFDFGKIWGGGA